MDGPQLDTFDCQSAVWKAGTRQRRPASTHMNLISMILTLAPQTQTEFYCEFLGQNYCGSLKTEVAT